ncbi:MAG: hypothetical protein KKD77_23920 [Gammaproteobacteria bacterium]|nr:hypothetical protein [Gammaproteobacteria bacterium]
MRDLLKKAIDLIIERYWDDLPLDVIALKTEAYYTRVLARGVRDVYNGKASADDLLNTMIRLLDEQLRRAWNEGMRQNGLDPKTDMTDEWEQILQDIISNEFNYVEQFIADVVEARDNGQPIEPLLTRVDLWASRYNEVVNRAILETAGEKDKLEWVLGRTEEHCVTCAALAGTVATAQEWATSGFRPQNPPNPMLECQGWRCDCELVPTDKRKTSNALDFLLELASNSHFP